MEEEEKTKKIRIRQRRTGFWWGNLKERDHLEDLCLYGRIILEWVLR